MRALPRLAPNSRHALWGRARRYVWSSVWCRSQAPGRRPCQLVCGELWQLWASGAPLLSVPTLRRRLFASCAQPQHLPPHERRVAKSTSDLIQSNSIQSNSIQSNSIPLHCIPSYPSRSILPRPPLGSHHPTPPHPTVFPSLSRSTSRHFSRLHPAPPLPILSHPLPHISAKLAPPLPYFSANPAPSHPVPV